MTPFKPGDIVRRIGYENSPMIIWNTYIVEIDYDTTPNGDNCIRLKWYNNDNYDRRYFELIQSANPSIAPFKVWDVVQYKAKSVFTKTWVIHSFIEDWMRFYFEDKNKNKSVFPYKTCDFELVAEVKDTNSNNDGCVTTVSDIKPGDYVRRDKEDYLEVKQWLTYKVYDTDKDGDLKLMIDWERSTYIYRASLFTKIDIHLHWTSCPPTLIVGDAWSVGATGDSNSSNPITPMSKTFNDYAVEAFMSNEENRTAATNARNVLQTLVDNLDLSMAAIEKIKRVVYCDFRDLNGAMEDSDITTIAKLVAENPAVKEFVERFMDNTLLQLIPEPVVTSTSIQDKFK